MEVLKSIYNWFEGLDTATLAILAVIGTILTVIGTAVTLWQASRVKKYKEQIAFDLRKISLSEAGEILRRCLDDSRKLLDSSVRGKSTISIYDAIQEKLDNSQNRFNQKSHDKDIKDKLILANDLLHKIRSADDLLENSKLLHTAIQEAIQLCNERVREID